MIEFKFEMQNSCDVHTHQDFELFYVLEGTVDFSLEDKKFRMVRDDYIIVNSERKHSYISENEVLSGCLHISYHELARLLKQNEIVFWCNSSLEENEQYHQIRNILKKIFSEHFKEKGRDEIYLNSLYYELLHELTHEFLLTREDRRFTIEKHKCMERKHAISEYVRLNYDKPISLNELSERLYLSNAYLSKYIKKQFGMSFLEYVNSVRLNHAITELIYSDKPVVRIAMDTGFANSAAFNKVFKKKYQMTPSVYRCQWKGKKEKSLLSPDEQQRIEEKLSTYFSKAEDSSLERENSGFVRAAVQAEEGTPLYRNWNQMINIGTAEELLDSDMQEHVLYLKKMLDFKYVRFWDLYSRQLFLDKHAADKKYNFSKLDRVLDFLVNHGLRPYIELGEKTKKLLKSRKKALIEESDAECFADEEVLRHFMSCLAAHLVNRYGQEEIEKWYFELWMKESNEFLKSAALNRAKEQVENYLDRFDAVAEVLRSYIPNIRIGGSGNSLQFGRDFFTEYIEQWSEHPQHPDFLTIYLYPYVLGEDPKKIRNQSMDENFMRNRLRDIREIVELSPMKTKDIHVTEWNFTVSNRNVLNDSCSKGAYLLKNIIDAVGMAQVLGYWIGSDLFADYYDSGSPLNGSGGLLTKDGITKPSYYAFDFMNRLGSLLYRRGDNYIITDNGHKHWRIACHNYKHFNYQYCLSDEDEIDIRTQNNLLSDVKRLKLSFELPVGKNRDYQLKIYSVNQDHGSVQDEWIRMEMPTEMTSEDITYLNRISIPRMVIKKVKAKNSTLTFETLLEPNEIQFIHVIQMY